MTFVMGRISHGGSQQEANIKNKESILNLIVQYLEKYSSTVQQLASSEQARITDWKQKRRWEMVELKDCQQQELEGKLIFHSLLTFRICSITAAFTFASEYPGLEIKILYYCIQKRAS